MDQQFSYDVVVVGGGSAGVAASVAAARKGASVCVVEKYGFLGGQATSANVGTICGLVNGNQEYRDTKGLAGRFANEFLERITALSPQKFVTYKNQLTFLPYESWAFEKACYDLVGESFTRLYLHATCIDIQKDSRSIKNITIFSHGRRYVLQGNVFIDATGEAILSKLADITFLKDENYQAPGFTCKLGNIPFEIYSEELLNHTIMKELLEANARAEIDIQSVRLTVVPGSLKNRSCILKLAFPFQRQDSLDSVTEIELFARRILANIFSYLKSNVSMFKDVQFTFYSTQSGLRSGPRGRGLSILSEEDVITQKKFSNYIANGLWPIEFWNSNKKPIIKAAPQDVYYQISADSLISDQLDNLYFSGRGISADEMAISSARVIGTCFMTGYAAGYLAGGKLNSKNMTDIIKELQTEQFALC